MNSKVDVRKPIITNLRTRAWMSSRRTSACSSEMENLSLINRKAFRLYLEPKVDTWTEAATNLT